MQALTFTIDIEGLSETAKQELALAQETGELSPWPDLDEEVVFKNPNAPPASEYGGVRKQNGMPDKRTKEGKAWYKAQKEKNTQIYNV